MLALLIIIIINCKSPYTFFNLNTFDIDFSHYNELMIIWCAHSHVFKVYEKYYPHIKVCLTKDEQF